MGCEWNKLLDIYSPEYNLRFKGKKSYNSTFGKLMGLISIIIFISLFINFTIELFSRKSFDILYSSALNNNFTINLTNVPFFLAIMDKNSNIIPYNESIFKFSFRYIKQIFKNSFEPENININYNIEECDESLLINEDLSAIKKYNPINLTSFKCFPKDKELILNGRLGQYYSSIVLTLSFCSDNNSNCDIETIENILEGGYLIMSYFSYSIDHYSYKKPIKKSFKTDTFAIPNRSLRKMYNYYFNGAKYESDNGLLFQKKNTINFFEPNGISLDIVLSNNRLNNQDNTLISIQFGCSEYYNIYFREYRKIQYYLGLYNGICEAIYIVCKFLSNYILLKMRSRDIVNEIFFKENIYNRNGKIQIKKNTNHNINMLNKKSINEIENKKISNYKFFSSENKIINNEINKNSIFTYENSNISFYNKYFKSIIFDIKHYFIPYFCLKKDTTIKILNELYENINSKISIEILYFTEEHKNKKELLNEIFSNKLINYI